jgi:DNA-binding transcriptional regulator YhcF (GntR family)
MSNLQMFVREKRPNLTPLIGRVSIPATAQKIGVSAATVAKSLEHMRRPGMLREISRRGASPMFVYATHPAILNAGQTESSHGLDRYVARDYYIIHVILH